MIRVTDAEYELIESASGEKPVSTCAREVLVRWARLHLRRR
jgi:hypothetical protein